MILFGQVSNKEILEQRFEAEFNVKSNSYSPEYNLKPGNNAIVITSQNPKEFSSLYYGLTPFWASSKIDLTEAPVDGDVPVFPPQRNLQKRIINMPAFRKPIRSQRCIIPADFIIVAENDGAYLFYLKSHRPFALGGVYDHWKLTIRDEVLTTGFCPITLPQVYNINVPAKRFPLIIPQKHYMKWIKKDTPINDIVNLLDFHQNNDIVGYPVDLQLILNGVNNERITKAIGEEVCIEENNSNHIINYFKNLKAKT